jgi:phosphoglucosamine mutase
VRVDAESVRRVNAEDGLYLGLDDGFLMLRLSGTEPLLRVYAEARGPRLLQRRLAAGAALLAGVSRGSR